MISRKQPRKWDSGFTQTRRRFSATKAPSIRTQKKHIEVGDMSIEILTRNESVKYLGQRISFYQQETIEIKSRIRAALGDLPQIQTRVDIKKLHAQTSSTAFRRHSFCDYLLRRGNMGSEQRTRMNDSIDTTQDATTHYPDKKDFTKRLRNKTLSPKTRIGKLTSPICAALMMKSGDGQSTKTHDDVDSEVSFEDDPDEEIDTAAIEEEDWIGCIKGSTVDALDKMERAKVRCWNRTHKK